MSMLNNIVATGLIFRGAYIWNEVSVSTCGRLIHKGLIFGGGLYSEVHITVYSRHTFLGAYRTAYT